MLSFELSLNFCYYPGMEVKPCNGQPPLVNPLTGAEYDCGSGPNRQDCPSSSYCHQTAQFARCCRKGDYLTTTSMFLTLIFFITNSHLHITYNYSYLKFSNFN